MSTRFREARRDDVGAIVRLLADDPIGAAREDAGAETPAAYLDAFAAIENDPNNTIIVGEDGGEVVACVQLTLTPSLTRRGQTRTTLEGIRVRADRRGGGTGEELITYAIEKARTRGATIVQLTTDKQRADARRFYERLGFEATHEGMKLLLT